MSPSRAASRRTLLFQPLAIRQLFCFTYNYRKRRNRKKKKHATNTSRRQRNVSDPGVRDVNRVCFAVFTWRVYGAFDVSCVFRQCVDVPTRRQSRTARHIAFRSYQYVLQSQDLLKLTTVSMPAMSVLIHAPTSSSFRPQTPQCHCTEQ